MANEVELTKKEVHRENPLKKFYRNIQPLWDPIPFTIITLVAALFNLVCILPIFYGITYPMHFVISYIHQARIKDDWVFEWVKKIG